MGGNETDKDAEAAANGAAAAAVGASYHRGSTGAQWRGKKMLFGKAGQAAVII